MKRQKFCKFEVEVEMVVFFLRTPLIIHNYHLNRLDQSNSFMAQGDFCFHCQGFWLIPRADDLPKVWFPLKFLFNDVPTILHNDVL